MLRKCYNYGMCVILVTFWGVFGMMISGCAKPAQPLAAWLPEGKLYATEVMLSGLPVTVIDIKKTLSKHESVHLYIEGDGDAFTPQGTPSANPTPRTPVALQLALADTTAARTLYISRPCQWVDVTQYPKCKKAAWTTQRFTSAVLQDYTALIEELTQNQSLTLIGYSGGAWLAYGVGQRLENATAVISVAGNLNPNAVNAHHHVPLMDVAPFTQPEKPLPMLMLTGGKDRVIPPKLSEAMQAERPAGCVTLKVIPEATHTEGWVENWRQMLAEILTPCIP